MIYLTIGIVFGLAIALLNVRYTLLSSYFDPKVPISTQTKRWVGLTVWSTVMGSFYGMAWPAALPICVLCALGYWYCGDKADADFVPNAILLGGPSFLNSSEC